MRYRTRKWTHVGKHHTLYAELVGNVLEGLVVENHYGNTLYEAIAVVQNKCSARDVIASWIRDADRTVLREPVVRLS